MTSPDRDEGRQGSTEIWVASIETFVRIYRHLKATGPQWNSYQALFEVAVPEKRGKAKSDNEGKATSDRRGYSTVVQRLNKLVATFVSDPGRQGEWKDFEQLFKLDGADGCILATRMADRLYEHLKSIPEMCVGAWEAAHSSQEMPFVPTKVRLGIPQTVGLYILSSVLSGWGRLFPKDWVDFEVEVDSTRNLIERVATGDLDRMIGYGGADERFLEPRLKSDIGFEGLNYETRSVLIAHPEHRLKLRGEQPGQVFYRRGGMELNSYDDIPEGKVVKFAALDPNGQALIVVPSFAQTEGQRKDYEAWKAAGGRIIVVNTYDDAMALVRMGRGITIAFEVYASRALVTPYRLASTPQEAEGATSDSASASDPYRRAIGQYFRNPRPRFAAEDLARGVGENEARLMHVELMMDFIRSYFTRFSEEEKLVQRGVRPALDDPEYEKFVAEFARSPLCRAVVEQHVRRLDALHTRESALRPAAEAERDGTLADAEAVRMLESKSIKGLNFDYSNNELIYKVLMSRPPGSAGPSKSGRRKASR